MKNNCVWFIEPKDAYTNNVIGKTLQELSYESAGCNITCYDGIRRDLWRCPDHRFVSRFERSKRNLNLSFAIWRKFAGGAVKPWIFPMAAYRRLIKRAQKS